VFGNVVTNKQIRDLIESRAIDIDLFEDRNIKAAAYTLNPGKVLGLSADGDTDTLHSFSAIRPSYTLAANAYVVIEVRQKVVIRVPGIIGTFITASTNIEHGLLVIAGQIDSKYGVRGEALRFGVKNLLDAPNEITISTRLVHMQLIDMRGSASDQAPRPKEVEEVWTKRIRSEGKERSLPDYGSADEV
jgi:hypothetical protein